MWRFYRCRDCGDRFSVGDTMYCDVHPGEWDGACTCGSLDYELIDWDDDDDAAFWLPTEPRWRE